MGRRRGPRYAYGPGTVTFTGSPSINPGGRTLHLPENTNQGPELNYAGYSCVMASDTLRYDFDPDPVSILWMMNANINLLPTRGGQVAYSGGRTVGPIQIMGYLRSRWDLLDLGDFVKEHMREAALDGKSLRFVYPERNLDWSVYIQNIDNIGLEGEVGEIVGYTLTCVITEDHTALKKAEVSQLVPGLPENVEWIDVESAAKIAEQRFGESFGTYDSTGGESGETQEGQDGEEDTNPEDEDVTGGPANSGDSVGTRPTNDAGGAENSGDSVGTRPTNDEDFSLGA